eukprot:403369194
MILQKIRLYFLDITAQNFWFRIIELSNVLTFLYKIMNSELLISASFSLISFICKNRAQIETIYCSSSSAAFERYSTSHNKQSTSAEVFGWFSQKIGSSEQACKTDQISGSTLNFSG